MQYCKGNPKFSGFPFIIVLVIFITASFCSIQTLQSKYNPQILVKFLTKVSKIKEEFLLQRSHCLTFVLEMLRLWRNLQFLARTCSEVSVILMHPHKLRCSKCLQFSVKVIIAVSDTLMQRRRYTVWSWQQEVKTLMTPGT